MTDGVVMVKCLVWDLDNTLWRGTLLEGDQVVLPAEVRAAIVELDSRGILQAVSSKNDHDTAWAQLEGLGIAEYFVLSEIGWGPKSDSLRRIAGRLNFAHHTMAFIDDQPAERAEVSFHLPEIRCYRADQADMLTGLPEFSPPVSTVDSRLRRRMYQAGFRRDAERADFLGPDEEFLRSLKLTMRISRAGEQELFRVEELTLRTSQMNATGVHYSHATLRDLLNDPWHEVLVATMTDRFGPHGMVGIILLEKHPGVWHLKLLASSCRVISFGVGSTLLSWLADQAAMARVHLVADFRRTDRNRMMEIAYRFADFRDQPCACTAALAELADLDGVHRLHLEPSPQPKSTTIQISAPQLGSRRSERASHG